MTKLMAQGWLSGSLRLPIAGHFPQGVFLSRDIRRLLPDMEMRQIFDVGANEGQTAIQFALAFPKARIDSFEPIGTTYEMLVKNVAWTRRIYCHKIALDCSCGTTAMVTPGLSAMSRIDTSGNETVATTTLQRFCEQHGVRHINLLKVDTEGYDLKVLQGAEDMIREQDIDLIEVEAGMNPENNLHVHFEEFIEYLYGFDYRIFGIYDQTHEWTTHAPNLRRADIAFISGRLLRAGQ